MTTEEDDDGRERWPIRPIVAYAIAYPYQGTRRFLGIGSIHSLSYEDNFMSGRVIKYKTKTEAEETYRDLASRSPEFAASPFEVVEVSCSVMPIRLYEPRKETP